MSLAELLHCPDCQGCLTTTSAQILRCLDCSRTIPVIDGIADFAGERPALPAATDRYSGVTHAHASLADGLPNRIKTASGAHWPHSFGDTIELGCGVGLLTEAILGHETVRSLLVLDTDMDMLRMCRQRIADAALGRETPMMLAALTGEQNVIRDAVADTIMGAHFLAGLNDVPGSLSMVYRILKPGGRAMFVVPNWRYRQAICLTLADVLTQHFGQHGVWPADCGAVMELLAASRRLLVRRDGHGHSNAFGERNLFDSDALEELCERAGFATARMIPLDPDPAGAETIGRLCRDEGAADAFAGAFAALAAAIGRPYLSLLSDRDSSRFTLLWLTKSAVPAVRIYTNRPPAPTVVYPGPDAVLGGAPPRWSVELLGWETPDGVVVKVGGWCLSNIDAVDVRITLGGNGQSTPVWRPRPDVHEVLNRGGIYHPLHAICSGLDDELRFPGVHPTEGSVPLRVEIVLAGGLTVTGPAPEALVMNEPAVIAH